MPINHQIRSNTVLEPEQSTQQKNTKLHVSLDYKIITLVLIILLLAMFAIWRPWKSTPSSGDRTITVIGEATIKSQPDEYVFNPNYEFKNIDKQKALDQLNQKSIDVVSNLKKIGVTDSQIKVNSLSAQPYYSLVINPDYSSSYTLSFTITLNNRDLAQKVQDYLTTTTPNAGITPQINFSIAKQHSLDLQARDLATQDARLKADQTAKNLGFSIGKIKSVDDSNNGGGIVPDVVNSGTNLSTGVSTPQKSIAVQPGQNSINYSVTVVYYLK